MNKTFILQKIKQALKRGMSNNLFSIAEANNILVLEDELGSICGFYTYQKKTKIILLNSSLSDLHKQMVLAHEIGHALLHTKVNCAFIKNKTGFKHQIYEKEANFFGANMLKEIGYLDKEDFCIQTVQVRDKDLDFVKELIDL
ncbi:MAG: ImmA/IrrE family metallo-endopeptidase [Cellulosilyticaceae bacterium]